MLKVITVATEKSGYFYALEESAQKLGYQFVVLGLGMKWKGFGWRVKLILSYLKTLPPHEIVLVVDAYDVALLRPASIALKKFQKLNVPFLCGAFKPLDGLLGIIQTEEFSAPGRKTFKSVHPYTSLCAGTWMAEARNALILWGYEKREIRDDADDQKILNELFSQADEDIIRPDANFNIFCTVFPSLVSGEISPEDELEVTDSGMLYSGVTRAFPVVIHGLANADMRWLLKNLGYENWKPISSKLYHMKKIMYHSQFALLNSPTAQQLLFAGSLLVIVGATLQAFLNL